MTNIVNKSIEFIDPHFPENLHIHYYAEERHGNFVLKSENRAYIYADSPTEMADKIEKEVVTLPGKMYDEFIGILDNLAK